MGSRNPTSSPLSSAQSSQMTFQTASSQCTPRFRPAQVLPFELLQQVKVYLEESLFTQALRFLQSLVSTSTSDEKNATLLPPPEYLALLSTLTIHPSFTTRAYAAERLNQSNSALRFLETINRVTGPTNAGLTEAYRFRRYDIHGARSQKIDSAFEDDFPKDTLNSSYADSESIFTLAEDFWAVVGWAFNCSCLPGIHASRWSYWGPWLEYMLDVLETDWELAEQTNSYQNSLLWQYIKHATGGTALGRRVLRAIFADGSPAALKEFRDVFRKELKESRSDKDKDKALQDKKQEAAVDVDQEIYGDWMAEEDQTSSDEQDMAKRDDMLQQRPAKKRLRPRAPRIKQNPYSFTPNITEAEDTDASTTTTTSQDKRTAQEQRGGLGPPEAVIMRLRFLQLLSTLAISLSHAQLTPKQPTQLIFPDTHELYTLYVEFIRPLPLASFSKIILPHTYHCHYSTGSRSEPAMGSTSAQNPPLSPASRIALCEFILQRLIETNGDAPHSGLSTFEPMTQQRLVMCYLPHTAARNTIEAQVKVSLLLESLLRVLSSAGDHVLVRNAELEGAVKRGIERREEKVREIREGRRGRKGRGTGKGRVNDDEEEEAAERGLRESGTRIMLVLEVFVRRV